MDQKLRDGTYRRDRHGSKTAGIVATGSPEAPAHLKGEALAFWNLITPRLEALGAKLIDSTELSAMCEWWGRYRRMAIELDAARPRNPLEILTVKRMLDAAKLAWREFDAIASRFGLTPSDRARLKVEPAPPPEDPFEKFLKKKRKA